LGGEVFTSVLGRAQKGLGTADLAIVA